MQDLSVDQRARVFAALSEPTRLRLVEMLALEEELCGTQLARRAEISMALLSHHWKVLADAGLVVRERRGQRQYCRVDAEILEAALCAVWPRRHLRSPLSASPRASSDASP
jgi:ArsR family transcriptional regulator, arsenate/arsenite/antimonite-responsive transcriptional repressor